MKGKTRAVKVGNLVVGGGAPVVIQSMTNTKTQDVQGTLRQINELHAVGCELIRIAVPDQEAVEALTAIVPASPMPVIADIHFDYRLALGALEKGVAGLRINPGNIGDFKKVRKIIDLAKEREVAIRVGVNGGSLPKNKIEEYGGPNAQAMLATILEYIEFFRAADFDNLVLSLKATDVLTTIEANRAISRAVDFPLHIGLTEAGPFRQGIIRSTAALAPLLLEGIGDTIRISLTEDPVQEILVAWDLLSALNLRQRGIKLISCPTCGRCEIDLQALVAQVEKLTGKIEKPLTVAVMGCAVNGPGEAREADLGVAGGKDYGVLFVRGKVVGNYPYEELEEVLLKAIEDF